MPAAITRDLGRFVAGLRFEHLPSRAVEIATLAFTDTIGVTIAGRNEIGPSSLLRVLQPAPGEATVLFGTRRARAPDAAWINGAAAHTLDYDDVALRGHPSAVIVPASLAEAEHLDLGGAEMLTAYVAAFETWAELESREPDQYTDHGWHATGWLGAVAAAAGCARLRGLPAEQASTALAIAASQGAGLMANTGTATKGLHAGRAANAGLVAARLAESGFTAAPDALENAWGFLRGLSPSGHVDLDRPVCAGQTWKIVDVGLSIRRYPVCAVAHRLIDGMIDLVTRTGVKADDVREIEVSAPPHVTQILRYRRPATAQESKFSVDFAVAAALLRARVGLEEVNDAFVQNSDLRALMERTRLRQIEGAAEERVTLRMRDGSELASEPVTAITGSPQKPLGKAEFRGKFLGCVAHGAHMSPSAGEALLGRLQALESLTSARQLRDFVC